MLNAITLKCFRAAIVHVHRQRDADGTLGIHQPFAIVLVDAEIIGNDLELVAGHCENLVVVNRHEVRAELRVSAGKVQMLFASENRRVKFKAAQGMSCSRRRSFLGKERAKSNGSTIPSEFVTSPPTHEN